MVIPTVVPLQSTGPFARLLNAAGDSRPSIVHAQLESQRFVRHDARTARPMRCRRKGYSFLFSRARRRKIRSGLSTVVKAGLRVVEAVEVEGIPFCRPGDFFYFSLFRPIIAGAEMKSQRL